MLPRAPFVGIVFFLIAGILVSSFLSSLDNSRAVLLACDVTVFVGGTFCYFKNFTTAFGVTFALFLLGLGILLKVSFEQSNEDKIAALQSQVYTAYEAEIKSLPEKRANSVRFEVNVKSVKSEQHWIPVNVNALVNVAQDAEAIPKPGDHILVRGALELPMGAANPMQFDYRRYLRNKGIVWTDYLDKDAFEILPVTAQTFSFQHWSTDISEWSARVFRENIQDDAAYGLVKAMLLGRRDDLHEEQVDDYTVSGAVHILSVSGMHVAIIFLVISFLLGWLKRWRLGKLLYLFAIVSLLGFYALVTGLPPSVQRATLMCMVFVIAEVFERKQHAMNTLAFSAFLILLFDPGALYDVGFQLSYLAMSGIFLLYEPINGLFTPHSRVLKFVWQISALSFAAQLATFPLSLFYFHQFPSYFWLVNPFVIAFTNVLLPAALVMLLVSLTPIFWLQWLVNKVVWLSAYLTNVSVAVPKSLPGNLVENLMLDKAEVLILYGMLLLLWLSYHFRAYGYLKAAYALALVLTCYSVSKSLQLRFSDQMLVHAVPKHSVISLKHDDLLYVISDKAFAADKKGYNFYLKDYAISQEVRKTIFVTVK
jgi:competence protein ComEC